MSACHWARAPFRPTRSASASGWVRGMLTVAVMLAAAVLAGAVAGGRALAQDGPQDGPAAGTPVVTADYLDAQLADVGTPAFVDGLAGLLIAHAGRNTERAGAIGRHVLARAPEAGGEVAEALRLAGFDPAVAGLDAHRAPARRPATDDVTGAQAADGASARPGMALVQAPYSPSGGGSSQFGGGGGGSGAGGVTLSLSAGQTARPGVAGLATPQLR